MEYFDDYEFLQRYRLTKDTVNRIIERVRPRLQHNTEKNNALSPTQQVLVALRFYATGAFQIICGDLTEASQKTCSRVIKRVSEAIADLRPEFISCPNTQKELQEVARGFYTISQFPSVFGAIDCTHIWIKSPGGENSERFRNRKGFFSMNVQTVSDAHLRILDIVVRWPGSTHDTTVFDNSLLRARFEAGEIPAHYHLLGDNGYPCRSYLMTPFLNPHSPAEEAYNRSQIRARNAVERQYGVWKRLFPCLTNCLRCDINTSLDVIVATAVLFNIALSNGVFPDDIQINEPQEPEEPVGTHDVRNISGFAKRADIVQNFFT